MTDHTPTTEEQYVPTLSEIRADYIRDHVRHFDAYQVGRSLTSEQESWGEAFDRWLADHDRKIAAKTLREAARGLPFPQDPYGGFDHESLRASQVQHGHWLRDRADRIEQGGES